MKAIALFGLAMLQMAIGLFAISFAVALVLFTFELGSTMHGVEMLLVIFMAALGAFATGRGATLLLKTLQGILT